MVQDDQKQIFLAAAWRGPPRGACCDTVSARARTESGEMGTNPFFLGRPVWTACRRSVNWLWQRIT